MPSNTNRVIADAVAFSDWRGTGAGVAMFWQALPKLSKLP
jgi:hypothetical protein